MQTTALNFIEKCLDNSVVVGDTVNLGEGHDPHSQIWDIWDIKLGRMSLELMYEKHTLYRKLKCF